MAHKILAVDDENDVLLVVKTALETEGYEVVTAGSGPEALEKLAMQQPDLVVLDVMMPGMSGFQVLEKIRANPDSARIPVIMLTGLSDKAKIREALGGGTAYYIIKPFEFQDLLSKVSIALNPANPDPLEI